MSTVMAASLDLYELVQAVFKAPVYHLVFEVLLILWIIRLLFFTKSYKPERTILTEAEKEALITEWQPEPLTPNIPEDDPALCNVKNRLVNSKIGKYVVINGQECLNLAALNFLGMTGRKDIEEHSIATIKKYGVGTCGPRGFYGTFDVHLNLEEKVASFLKCEEAILYSYGFATIASAIPAYSKRGDIIFCDAGVNFAIQKGILASRSRVEYFKHNDMEDLERILKDQEKADKKNPKKAKATRRFLVVEGLYINYGDICPLPKLIELKERYKVRVILDESVSFGTLGKSGRGVTEHFGVSIDEITLTSVSLENALSSNGGLCVGRAFVIDHQRLSGQGYCFSASLPPLLATSAEYALGLLEKNPDMVSALESNSRYMHQELRRLEGIKTVSEPISPIQHLRLEKSSGDWSTDRRLLQQVVEKAEEGKVAITIAAYLVLDETHVPPPSIRISVSCELSQQDIKNAIDVLSKVCESVLR